MIEYQKIVINFLGNRIQNDFSQTTFRKSVQLGNLKTKVTDNMKNDRINISSNSPWEDKVGYSRAVKIDNHIFISGTTATDTKGNIVGLNDPFAQTIQCIENIKSALHKANAELSDVVRIRIYVVNIDDWETIGKALSKFFLTIKPAATMVEVNRLITPEILVEIEANAYLK